MRNNIAIVGLFCVFISTNGSKVNAQQELWFGTAKMQDKIVQGRFEVFSDSTIKAIVYAPYGISPTAFTEVRQQKSQLTFRWKINLLSYQCFLEKQDSTAYKGICTCDSKPAIQLIIRKFSVEDAFLQGDSLHAAAKDITILNRALNLLNNGSNWNRFDNRVCDIDSYPYKWSLFCALHQASIDIDSEYRHLRPAIQAVRQAIGELTHGKKYAHLLQDYNNEAQSFESIVSVLNRAKEIIIEKIKLQQ